jgi:hypothetical protein
MNQDRQRDRRRLWIAASTLVLGACGADEPAPIEDRAVTVSADQLRVLPALDVITRVVDLERTGDGRVWVLNSSAPYFVLLGPDGRMERQFGQRGGGPEEFGRPVELLSGTAPDEVWAYDLGRHALIRVSGDRRDLHLSRDSLSLPSLITFRGAGVNAAPPWVERTREGFLVARARRTREESALHLWNADILLIPEEGSAASGQMRLPAADLLGDPASRYGAATILLPYPLWTGCADGTVALYDPLPNAVRRFTTDRRELDTLALPAERRSTMTADLVFEMFYRQFAEDRPSDQVPDMEQMRSLTAEQNEDFVRNSAGSFPEYSELRCAARGTLWLRRFDATTGRLGLGPDWLRLGPDGSRTEVALPRKFRTFLIERDTIWGTVPDSLGVESVAWVGLDSPR